MSKIELDARAFLSSLDDYLEDVLEGLQQDIEKAALTLERNAKQKCPVDTGKLRASITTEVGNLEAEVGTNVEYAPCVEFGTSKQKAQPFMRPALDKAITQLNKDMAKTLGGK